jgi:Xaa-Pro aminopeptidase
MTHYKTKDDPEIAKAMRIMERDGISLRRAMTYAKGGFKEGGVKPISKGNTKKSHVK